jgi:quinolinate synthase
LIKKLDFTKKNKNMFELNTAEQLQKRGYLGLEVDPTLDLVAEIQKLKKEKNAVILAHYYQDGDIQDIADYIGDSLGLSQEAARTDADMIVFAGVHFMAETAKMLSPHKKVVLPDLKAGCSLADSCPPAVFAKFKEKHPDHIVVSYINCTAELKTMTDVCCTSTNAVQIIESLPKDAKIIFAPDKNLGQYLIKKTGRDMLLWNGACMVHEIFSLEKITKLRARHPNAKYIAHPECEPPLLEDADFIGSTTGLLNYTIKSEATEFIVATEAGILHQMQKASPHKTFIPAPPNNSCACNECPYMRLNTLEKLYLCMKYELPEVTLPQWVIDKGRASIDRMLEVSAKAGL